jgi:hypothetical protein
MLHSNVYFIVLIVIIVEKDKPVRLWKKDRKIKTRK